MKYIGNYTAIGGKISEDSSDEIKPNEVIDVLGYHCPMPVSFTRKKLQKMSSGEILEVLADDPETKIDIPKLVERLGCELLASDDNSGVYKYLILNK